MTNHHMPWQCKPLPLSCTVLCCPQRPSIQVPHIPEEFHEVFCFLFPDHKWTNRRSTCSMEPTCSPLQSESGRITMSIHNHDDQHYHYHPRQRGSLVYIFDWKQRQIQFSSLEEQHLFKRETWRIGTATACVPAKKQNQKRQQYQGHHPCDCRVLQIIAFMKCSFEVW